MSAAISFQQLLKSARIARKMTLRELGEALNRSPSLLSEIETGKRLPPRIKTLLESWSRVLGLDYVEVYKLAHQTRKLKTNKRISRLLKQDDEFAVAFSKAAENMSDEELKTTLLNALRQGGIDGEEKKLL